MPAMYEPIEVADTSPAELSRATQAIADALEHMIAEAPDQWYTFKPMWPETETEAEALARRAAEAAGVTEAVEGAPAGVADA